MPAKREEGRYKARTKKGLPCRAAASFRADLYFLHYRREPVASPFFISGAKFFAVACETLQAALISKLQGRVERFCILINNALLLY